MSDHKTALMQLAFKAQINSYTVNPRLLEDTTYPCWDYVMHKLCGSRTYLWPAPQWRLYVSPLDSPVSDEDSENDRDSDNDADSGSKSEDEEPFTEGNTGITIPDKNAVEVITDFAIIMPVFEHDEDEKDNDGPFAHFASILDAMDQKVEWQPHKWFDYVPKTELSYLIAPMLAELKKPLTRNAFDIEAYFTELQANIEAAQSQVEQQAICLLCSPKYSKQQRVILIAGASEWWTFEVISRKNMEDQNVEFDMDTYLDLMESSTLRQNLIHPGPEDEFEAPVRMKDVADAALALKEKARTSAERRRPKKIMRQAKTAYDSFVNSTSAPFTDDDLTAFCAHVAGPTNPTNNTKLHNFKVIFDIPTSGIDAYADGNWSPVMRLGTKASNYYIRVIKSLLETAVDEQLF